MLQNHDILSDSWIISCVMWFLATCLKKGQKWLNWHCKTKKAQRKSNQNYVGLITSDHFQNVTTIGRAVPAIIPARKRKATATPTTIASMIWYAEFGIVDPCIRPIQTAAKTKVGTAMPWLTWPQMHGSCYVIHDFKLIQKWLEIHSTSIDDLVLNFKQLRAKSKFLYIL